MYAEQAIECGCAYAVVDEKVGGKHAEKCIVVNDVLGTLQALAHFHRMQIKGKVIALTGSNGKTTSKELMAAVLGSTYKVAFTKGNLNNHIGVPLTILDTVLTALITLLTTPPITNYPL